MADTANSPGTGLSAPIMYVYPWWLVLLWGLLSLVVGVMFLGTPAATTVFLISMIGVFWLVGGIFTLGSLVVDKTHAGLKIFISDINIIAGLLILTYPLYSTIFALALFVIFIGVFGCFIGVSHLYHAFRKKDVGSGVLGVISLIFGILLLAFPLVAAVLIPFIIGIFALAGGIAAVIASFSIKKAMCGPS